MGRAADQQMTVLSSEAVHPGQTWNYREQGEKRERGSERGGAWGERIPQRKALSGFFEELFIPCIRFQLSDQLIG